MPNWEWKEGGRNSRGEEVLDKLENKLASLAHSSEDRSTARNRDPTNRLRPLNSLFGKARARGPPSRTRPPVLPTELFPV